MPAYARNALDSSSLLEERRILLSEWTKERIQRFLREEEFPYRRKIELPYHLCVPGKDPKRIYDMLFPECLAGKSVFVVGSYLGDLCLEAVERGAGRVVGWEINPDFLRKARIIAAIKGRDVEYVQRDIEVAEPEEQFDIILCLDVLQYMFNPVLVLDRLIRHAREQLILEMASPDSQELNVSWLQRTVLTKTPSIVVGKGSTHVSFNARKEKKYYVSKKALLRILQRHRNVFAAIDVFDAEAKGRFLVTARKRRIAHLLVVAGLAATGKTTLIKRLISGEYPELSAALDSPQFDKWDIVDAEHVFYHQRILLDGLIFHYNPFSVYRSGSRLFTRDEVLHVLDAAEKISFITVYTESERLLQQLEERRRSRETFRSRLKTGYAAAFRYLLRTAGRKMLSLPVFHPIQDLPIMNTIFRRVFQNPHRKDSRLLKLYRNSEQVLNIYREWFDYIETLDGNVKHNLIVTTHPVFRMYTHSEWEKALS